MESLRLLLATNGFPQNRQSLKYGIWLAESLEAPIFLLGVVEKEELRPHVEALVDEFAQEIAQRGIPHQKEIQSGRASILITQYANSGLFVTVVGQLGRPLWRRLLQGRSFRRISSRLKHPLFYVPRVHIPIRTILLNLGGLEYSRDLVSFTIFLAQKCSARIHLLHIVEPINLSYPVSYDLLRKSEDLLHTQTPQAKYLSQSMVRIQSAGLEVELKVRRGNAVHEILSEVHQGQYDLIGFGSHFSSRSLRHHFLPDVTAEVAEAAALPVLMVPYQGAINFGLDE